MTAVSGTLTTRDAVALGRARRARRRALVTAVLGLTVLAVFSAALMIGNTFYGPGDVFGVLLGQRVPGASFTVGELRLPRSLLGVLAGVAFGASGVTFQTLLRNALASPDVIGISSGASLAAVIAIVVLHWGETAVSVAALTAALGTAIVIYLLASRGRFAGTRLILIGIGVAAMLDSLVSSVLLKAAQWDLQIATRWLTGSLNGATWDTVLPLLVAVAIGLPVLIGSARGHRALQLGDDSAAALGVRVTRTRVVMILVAVVLLAFATAATGPIAFVAFMAGPIAARLVSPGGSLVVPAALVGALLVLLGDLAGQYALPGRFPVGVVTGILGAPYLVYLLIRTNRSGGSL